MEYIYEDERGRKQKCEIKEMTTIPYYIFTMEIEKKKMRCHIVKNSSDGWIIYLKEIETIVGLAHPTDTFWNSEALSEKIKDVDTSIKIAEAIKKTYERYKNK